MQITDCKMTKRGRIGLFCDGTFLFSVHPDLFVLSGLKKGGEYTAEQLEEIRLEAARFDCRETLKALKGTNIAVPPLETYAWRLWD